MRLGCKERHSTCKMILATLHNFTRFLQLRIFLLMFGKDFGYKIGMNFPDVLERLARDSCA